jgi:hypothetical protein
MDEPLQIFIHFRDVPVDECPTYFVTAETRDQLIADWKRFDASQGRSGPRVYPVTDRSSAGEPRSLMLRLEDVLSIS